MKNRIIRVKDYLLKKILKIAGLTFGFGSISLMTMCAKYGLIADSGTIKGKVTSSQTGETIKKIEININASALVLRTDDNGNFIAKYLEPKQYTVEAKDTDGTDNGEFQNSVKTVELKPDDLINCDFALDPK